MKQALRKFDFSSVEEAKKEYLSKTANTGVVHAAVVAVAIGVAAEAMMR